MIFSRFWAKSSRNNNTNLHNLLRTAVNSFYVSMNFSEVLLSYEMSPRAWVGLSTYDVLVLPTPFKVFDEFLTFKPTSHDSLLFFKFLNVHVIYTHPNYRSTWTSVCLSSIFNFPCVILITIFLFFPQTIFNSHANQQSLFLFRLLHFNLVQFNSCSRKIERKLLEISNLIATENLLRIKTKFRVIMSNCNAISRYGTKKKSSSPFLFFRFCRIFYFSFIAPVLTREHDSWWCSDVIKKAQQMFYAPLHSMPPRLLLFFSRYVNTFCSFLLQHLCEKQPCDPSWSLHKKFCLMQQDKKLLENLWTLCFQSSADVVKFTIDGIGIWSQ